MVNNRKRQQSKVHQKCLTEEQMVALELIGDANRRVLKDTQHIKHMDTMTYMSKLIEYTLEGARRYCSEQETEEEI